MVDAISPFIRQAITRNADGSLDAPKNIIKTLSAAYQQYTSVRLDHLDRIAVYAAIQGMLDFNPPYDQAELEENGLGHIANFNNGKACSWFEKEAQGYWNLINTTEVFTKIILNPGIPDSAKFADIIARHFSDVVKEWEDFHINFNLLGSQLTAVGLCPVIFPHEESPMWEVVDASRFYIPSQSQSYISKLSNLSVDTTYTVQQLYDIYEKADEESDWNKEALATFLLLRANAITQNTSPMQTLVELQRFIANSDSVVNRYFTDTVRLVNMYQKEYTGEFTHYIFSADMFNVATTTTTPELTDFLFFKDKQYKRLEDAAIIFTASPGKWTIHGNIGAGQKMFALAQAINTLDCSVLDMAKMSTSILVQTLGTSTKEAGPMRIYPGVVNDIGASEFKPNTMGANINQVVGAAQYLSLALNQNTVNSGDDPGVPDKSQGSVAPSVARNNDFREFGGLRNVVAHFYNTFDKIVRTTFIRFLKLAASKKREVPGWDLAQEFKKRCIEDGVPEQLLEAGGEMGLHGLPRNFRAVKATRVAGDGSTLARIMGLETFASMGMTELLNTKQQENYKREVTAATLGVDYIPEYTQDDDLQEEVTGGTSQAAIEDMAMALAGSLPPGLPLTPVWSANNDQAAHADEHIGACTKVVQAVQQQQMNAVDADKIMELEIPHITQHIQYMEKAPQFYKQILNKIEKPWKQLMQWAQLNKRNAEAIIEAAKNKQAADQQATQGVMDDKQRKDFVARTDATRKDETSQAKIEQAQEQSKARGEDLFNKTQSDIEIKRYKAQQEVAIKRASEEKKTAVLDNKQMSKNLKGTPSAIAATELSKESSGELTSLLQHDLGKTPSTNDFEVP